MRLIRASAYQTIVLVAGTLIGSSYWAVACLLDPAEPFYVKLLLRGDQQYFPLIESLSRLEFFPTYSAVFSGSGLVGFPLAALAPHALGFALAGPPGFILIDMLAVAMAAYVFYILFRLGAAPKYLAALLAIICIGSMFVPYISEKLYAFRIPRPEISDIYFITFFCYALLWFRRPSLFFAGRRGTRRVVGFAVVTALVLQSFFYFFIIALAILLMLLAESLAFRRIRLDRATGKTIGLFVFSCTVASLPFLVQMLWGEPDLKARMGAYSATNRVLVLEFFGKPILSSLILPCGLAAILVYFARRRRRCLRLAWFSLAIPVAAALAGISFLAGSPLYIQLFHVPLSIRNVDHIALLLMIPQLRLLLLRVSGQARFLLLKNGPRAMGVVVTAVVLLIVVRSFSSRYSATPIHVNARFEPHAPAQYRKDLGTVIRHLQLPRGTAPRQLLTNDKYLPTWWVMERQGTLLLPNVFSVVLQDRQVETQLIQAGKFLGWDNSNWSSFLSQDRVMDGRITNLNAVFFLGHNKYQASSLYSWGLPDDYPLSVRSAMENSTSSWSISLPLSERSRLNAAYSDAAPDPRFAPDLIVMAKLRDTPAPLPTADYRVTLELANFTVWQRRPNS